MSTDRGWIYRKNDSEGFLSKDYVIAMDGFLDIAFANEGHVEKKTTCDGIVFRIRCPCSKCRNLHYRERDEVRLHLMKYGFMPDYTIWWAHGEIYRASQDVWDTDVFRCQSRVVRTNRATRYKGVPSKYSGGSISAAQHRVRMRDEWGREPTDAELYERLHTKRKPVSSVIGPPMDPPSKYVYPKAARTVKTYVPVKEEKYVGSNFSTVPVDDPELSECIVVGRHKSRLFAMAGDPNAISSSKSSNDNQSAEVNALKEKLDEL